MFIKGIGYEGKKTKDLVKTIPKKGIAILHHEDIDTTAAQSLIEKKVKAVLNYQTSMTGNYEHDGIYLLLKANIPVFDIKVITQPIDKEKLMIGDGRIFRQIAGVWLEIGKTVRYNMKQIDELKEKAREKLPEQFASFASNSLLYAQKEIADFSHVENEKSFSLFSEVRNKEVLIVIRGANYEQDLKAIWPSLRKKKPIIIAVDGAADTLIKWGIEPNIIVGDMDSVSESSLRSGARLIAHSYKNGTSPGMVRLKKLQLKAENLSFVGTSEDVAIIFSYWASAKKIYLIGSRSSMCEFLEKGRKGMGASVLVRMQAGHLLVDLKGIHELMSPLQLDMKYSYIPAIFIFLFLLVDYNKFTLFFSIVWNWLTVGG